MAQHCIGGNIFLLICVKKGTPPPCSASQEHTKHSGRDNLSLLPLPLVWLVLEGAD